MNLSTQAFMTWLMSLTRIMRYFVVALLVHAALIFLLASVKIVVAIPAIKAVFTPGELPKNIAESEPDPTAVFRDFEYNGPTLGGGGGTPGKGPGGIPTAAGNTPTEYKASIVTGDTKPNDSNVGEVIGVVADVGAAIRPQGSPGGISAPTTGLGEGMIGTAGVKGPGGGGFGQRQGPIRSQIMNKTAKGRETERAVLAALRWLRDHQRADGSWECGPSVPAGTALAVLAFLGHGETPESQEFGNAVNKGMQFLVGQIGPDGLVTGHNGYAQGAVTLALAEAYGMTQSAAVKESLDRAVNAIVRWQKVPKENAHHNGGWRYQPDAKDADTSVSGWMIMALKSARLAGLKPPEEAFEDSAKYLWAMYANGQFGYDNAGHANSPATTAIGVLCLQFLGRGDDPRIKKALDKLKEQKAEWDKAEMGWVLYDWYYTTYAMFQGGGSYWEHWNKQISDTMIKVQADDGHWDVPPGSKSEKNLANPPVYPTAVGALILEVYYRYLPLMKEMEKPGIGAAPGTASH